MIGFTPREAVLAVEHGGHAAGFGLALAELSMYWDQYPDGAPEMHEPRLNIRITAGGTIQDRIDTVKRIADWLGVGVTERYGVHIAQRRFGTGEDSVLLEAHFTPDQDRTHALIREAAGRHRKDAPELTGAAA